MTLPLYIARRFLMAVLRVGAIVVLLFGLFEFLENSRRYGSDAEAFSDVVWLSLLGLPSQISAIMPLILLLASLTLFLGLARSSELVVSRASGVSAFKVLYVPVVLSIVIGALFVAVANPIVASTIRRFETMQDRLTGQGQSVSSFSEQGLWLRQVVGDRQTVIQARRASPSGGALFDVDFHVFDDTGRLSERILATSAVLRDEAWQLNDVRRWMRGSGPGSPPVPVELSDANALPTNLTREQILDSFAQPESISVWDLGAFIEKMEVSGFSATRHKLHLQSVLSTPIMFAAMVLIGASFTMRHVRFGHIGTMIVLTVISGFALYAFQNMAASLGAAGRIPVEIAAWAPPIAAIMAVTGLLLHLEDG